MEENYFELNDDAFFRLVSQLQGTINVSNTIQTPKLRKNAILKIYEILKEARRSQSVLMVRKTQILLLEFPEMENLHMLRFRNMKDKITNMCLTTDDTLTAQNCRVEELSKANLHQRMKRIKNQPCLVDNNIIISTKNLESTRFFSILVT